LKGKEVTNAFSGIDLRKTYYQIFFHQLRNLEENFFTELTRNV